MPVNQPAINDLAARHAIRNALAVHSRGVDRADANLLGSAYHPGATVDYGFFVGPAETLVSILAGAQKAALPTLHRTGHGEIRVAGNRAVSESTVIAHAEEPDIQRMVFGRYLDRLEQRDGDWRLVHRTYVLDSNTNRPNTARRANPPVAPDHFVPEGGKGASDPGRALLARHHAATRHLQKAPPMTPAATAIDAALAREDIRLLLAGYCRAVDRADAGLMASLFWDDAEVISGVVNGPAGDFAREIAAFVTANLDSCFHSIANEWIEVTGDHAVGEHYILAHNRAGAEDTLTGGRYLDRYERRGGVWKIASRVFVCDWTATHPTTYEPAGFYEGLTTRGSQGTNDPVYRHWESL
ncbi:MAG: nuclear transport factor 2 family protein [Sphingomonadales bacterium]|nr:nuclear transport factor 2 family protein [Sphingomonadales bacterium]